ncbi:hypothetical protein BATDEDRAFT_88044 [Batrachochytrium dendrobatidis JAM81]|uniref:RRM domain-containing protein n=1 Tax=Batrachochytrium dendrobatidis (strain JAM81 / FGSC 10211) TaxID=684364 RepID=F4P1C1_BATDJ|nr:uncharacterized protein BATDEDRAFT_88044 [Batrachochytrium dendrobatidis JAM81]EGF80715.1 hypothetical protein BATDEDRAFT_88044 [Batrachochytrium dendrobatidis JAM81]|eukprot:XP_006678664.1 hypothetical protein BATDEDRAFT_88044 [Batrachochytrium dendrobatidis JAM81]
MSKTTLFVRGFSPDTSTVTLSSLFEKIGKTIRCDFPNRRGPHGASSFAFVEYKDPQDAQDAFDSLNGKEVDGKSLVIEWAKTPLSDRRPGGSSQRDRVRDRDYDRDSYRREDYRYESRSSRYRSRSPDRRYRSRSPPRDDRRYRSRSPSRDDRRNDHSKSDRYRDDRRYGDRKEYSDRNDRSVESRSARGTLDYPPTKTDDRRSRRDERSK